MKQIITLSLLLLSTSFAYGAEKLQEIKREFDCTECEMKRSTA